MSMTNDPYLLDDYPVLHDVVMPVCRQGFGNSNCSMPMCDCREMPIEFAGPEPRNVEEFEEAYDWKTILLALAIVLVGAGTLAVLAWPSLSVVIAGVLA